MKAKELKQKTAKELEDILNESKKKLWSLRYETSGNNKNVKETKELKKDIARVLTFLNKQKSL